MAKHLVIVESPAKAKTIHKFLGSSYEVRASMGHVRDLPKNKFGISIEDKFNPEYKTIPTRTALIKELSELAKSSDSVFLATDLDREGEAIAWHLAEALKVPEKKLRRVIFNQITKKAILDAFKKSGKIQMSKVWAQQARRILDRIVGYQLSPLLWEKITRGLSAGRVQSVAVKLIVEKEKEIRSFQSEEYWKITADLQGKSQQQFEAELKKHKDKKIQIPDEKSAKKALSELTKKKFVVSEIVGKEKSESPPSPFTTSLLQQQASIKLRFSTKQTMMIAQQLYEGIDTGSGPVGLITYMRTDSVFVSDESLKQCREYIEKNFEDEYLPKSPRKFKNKNIKAQEAHEAIRPTSVNRSPKKVKKYLSAEQYKLYNLIWQRFVASQMAAARYAHTNVKITAGDYQFESKGKQIIFPGFLALAGVDEKENSLLPKLEEKEQLDVLKLNPSQHFTQPPPRFSEATLVKTLESKGIGRPSTYSPIISTIQDRGYVSLKERKFYATELGIKVTEKLVEHFPHIIDTGFTSELENQLDQIEEKEIDWVDVLQKFYDIFQDDLEKAYKEMQSLKDNPEVSEYDCEKCSAKMVYKYNRYGKFLACSQYPECKHTVPIGTDGNPIFPEITQYSCPQCSEPLVLRQGRLGKFFGCSKFPDCTITLPIGADGKPALPEETDQACELCKSPMVIKQGKKGSFLACSNYPECKNTKPLDDQEKEQVPYQVKENCGKCGKPMAIRTSRRGVFLGCTGYPKCRNLQKFSPDMIELPPELRNCKCDRCGAELVLKGSSRGLFLGCKNYPSCENTMTLNEALAMYTKSEPEDSAVKG